MSYELGKVLKFNSAMWGLINYQKGKLTVLPLREDKTIKDKNKLTFKVDEPTFKRFYLLSSETSQEVIDFALNEEMERKSLMNKLKAGVKFIGSNAEEYTFLRFKGKKVNFYKGNDEFSANPEFIQSLTGEFDDDYINHLGLIETKKEYNSLTNEERVKIAINFCKDCYNQEGTGLEILEIGNIVSGEAFYHEVDACYNLIGLQIKFKYKFDFQEDYNTEVGFFPIYTGKLPDYYPVLFEESFSVDFTADSYTNGYGDEIEIDKILVTKDKLDKIAI